MYAAPPDPADPVLISVRSNTTAQPDRFESNSMGNRLLKGWNNTIVNQQLGAIPDAADVRKTFEKGWNGTGDVDTYGFA